MEPFKPESELQRFYHRLLRPLSLFPSRVMRPESPKCLPQEVPMLLPSFPVPPLTVESLCQQVAQRLARCEQAERMPSEGRVCFLEVILDELKCSWQEPPTEPSLSCFNNERLQRRVLVYVLLSCELLFLRYLHLLKTMPTASYVFTEPATLTRLAANLAWDCTVFLTSPEVYRGLLADFRDMLKVEQSQGTVNKLRRFRAPGAFKPRSHRLSSATVAQMPAYKLNLSYLIQLSRSRDLSEPRLDPVKELKSIPKLKRKKLLCCLPAVQKKGESVTNSLIKSLPRYSATLTSGSPPTSHLPFYSQLQKGQSMPSLREGFKLADELGLPPLLPRPLTPLVLFTRSKPELAEDMVAEDLKQIMKNMKLEWIHNAPMDSGVPPLLGALTHHPARRMELLQRMLKEEEKAPGQWCPQFPKSPPLHPQPVTVTLKLRNQMVVQAAGVQVSERKFLDSFNIEGTGALYNHLVGELDPKLIEEMDVDRFFGHNIREVYKELMSRVSTDHFAFDQGPLVEPAASKDWSMFLTSAFLRQEKQYHVINPKLTGLCAKKVTTDRMSSHTLLQASKTVGMSWWKTALSADDYFKYLTNQETDFLHVIFQMYEEEAPVEIAPPVRESLKIQPPPPLLEDEEPDFVPGEWDWNTVLGHQLDKTGLPGEPHKILSLQKRLQRLWSMLEVPNKDRLDMVIKYSSNARLRQLPLLVSAWEQTLKPIQLREILLGKLEWFERQASDPNRFFQKTGLDHFLEENQIRNHLHQKLNLMEASLVSLLEEVESLFGEPVIFKGRRYLDKMKHDKVEMLYWLQQRRRMHHLFGATHRSAKSKRLSRQSLTVPRNTPRPSAL